jgi:hypothetical protein
MKQWRVRSVEETDARKFAARLQSALNSMEKLGLEITVDRNTVAEGVSAGKFVAVVTGHGDIPEKPKTETAAAAPASA